MIIYGNGNHVFGKQGLYFGKPEPVVLLDFYPIGTLYKSVNADFDPNVTFGGTWTTVNFEGKTPIGFFDANSLTGGGGTHENRMRSLQVCRWIRTA